jgi:hypothetical protein
VWLHKRVAANLLLHIFLTFFNVFNTVCMGVVSGVVDG